MKIYVVLTCLLLSFASVNTYAEEIQDSLELKPKFGVFANFNVNLHTADITEFPGILTCCPKYTGGFGMGYTIGAVYDMYYNERIRLHFRASYMISDGLLSSEEDVNVIIDGISQSGKFEHLLDAELSSLGLESLVAYKFDNGIIALAGARIGFMTAGMYDYKEEISQPENRGTFEGNGQRTRNPSDGDIQDLAAIEISPMIGVCYELPANKNRTLFIAPELFYMYRINSIISGNSWNVHTFRAGLALKYRQPPPPPPPPPPAPDAPMPDYPVAPDAPSLAVSVSATQIDSNGFEPDDFDIKIEDFITHNMRPLLNYFFFDENSADLPERYKLLNKAETEDFSLLRLHNMNVMDTYYHALNIMGKRLQQNPDDKIKITGHNADRGTEKKNKALSKARAETIRDYFRDVWGVDESRMTIKARNLPRDPSKPNEAEGMEENRRVEILCSNRAILEPVITVDTLREISAATIRFYPNIDSDVKLKSWKLTVKQGNSELTSFSGKNDVPEFLEWNISTKDPTAPNQGGQITYVLEAEDVFTNIAVTEDQWLPVKQITLDRKRLENLQDKEFEYYSLILFDYGKMKLSGRNKKLVNFVKQRVRPKSSIVITGYSDKMGEERANQRISDARAKEVSRLMKLSGAKVRGVGESDLLYDNDLPEGRFYCRTVVITIETPVNGNGAE
ncbi:MAG: OmpA family protein [Chlorobi bacterium]|nr:OmpA family protein [Chlorobiota bacterium]